MVDVLSSFVSALMAVLLERLASRKLLEVFRSETSTAAAVEYLRLQLLSVNVLLGNLEEKETVDPSVKIWVADLQEAVYDAQDLLDQITTEALKLNSGSNSLSAVDLGRQLWENLTSKLNSNLDKINERLRVLRDQRDCLCLKESFERQSPLCSSRRNLLCAPTTRMIDQSKVFGRHDDKEKITQCMFPAMSEEVERVRVVAIVGMAGVGKTTLCQLLFNDPVLLQRFHLASWVHVSEGSDVLHLTAKVYNSVTGSSSENSSLNMLQVQLNGKLIGRRLLLVLDDFWAESFFDWDLFKMSFTSALPGSIVLVTTRNENVAIAMHAAVTYFLSPLSNEVCWNIFAHYAFGHKNPINPDPTLVEIGEKIVRKCKGVPLAAKVLGSLLYSVTDVEQWNDILQSNMWELPTNKSNILPSLILSYRFLPSHLKACFAYCSILPKGYEIDKWNLINLWVAEGLLQPSKTKTQHRVGEECLQELFSRSLLQSNGSSITMHDLQSDLAQYVAGEFFHFSEDGNAQKIPQKVRHLAFLQDKVNAYEKFEVFYELSKLRTFLPFRVLNSELSDSLAQDESSAYEVFNNLVEEFANIRVLSFPGYPITKLPTKIGDLMHVRYLNLSSTRIEQLPESIGHLYNLQTLLLSNCVYLTSLPNNMAELTNLCHLDITGVPLTEMPPHFGKLLLLWHLSTFVLSENTGSRIGELGSLSQLHGSLSIVNLQNVIDATDASGANLIGKKFLEELILKWERDIHCSANVDMILDKLQPHENLKRLKIENHCGATFPGWLGNALFSNMVSVHLIGCINCMTLPPLGQLPSLKTLLVAKMRILERVGPEFCGNSTSPFRALETLTFVEMEGWKEWESDNREEFPSLKELNIRNCPKLVGILLRCLGSLNKLVVSDCNVLASLLPRVPKLMELELIDCGALVSLHGEMMQGNTQLRKLTLCNCSSLQSIAALGVSRSLESLHIRKCKNLELFPPEHASHYYQSIKHLHLDNSCDTLAAFPLSSFRELRDLCIQGCLGLQSLWMLDESTEGLSHLANILLQDCPNLVSFSNVGLATPNLKVLMICSCEKLLPQVGWGLHEISSLQYFGIEGKLNGLESFPEEQLLPACLTDLHIIGLERLKSLNHAGLQHLVSLKRLVISGCDVLEFLPDQGLPGSLTSLAISSCPLLVPRCQFQTGAYWPLIAHIPSKDIG